MLCNSLSSLANAAGRDVDAEDDDDQDRMELGAVAGNNNNNTQVVTSESLLHADTCRLPNTALVDNNNSLQCLATPIRRVSQNHRQQQLQQQQQLAQQRVKQFQQLIPETISPRSNIPAADLLCCPIWSFAMAQLDARQGQPRDQGSLIHLIGPPATHPFLLAPKIDACHESHSPATQNSGDESLDDDAAATDSDNSNDDDKSMDEQQHSSLTWARDTSANHRLRSASSSKRSIEADSASRLSAGDESQLQQHSDERARRCVATVDSDNEQSTSPSSDIGSGVQMSRPTAGNNLESIKTHRSRRMNKDDDDDDDEEEELEQEQEQEQDEEDDERTMTNQSKRHRQYNQRKFDRKVQQQQNKQMKRFSSASCLALAKDHHQSSKAPSTVSNYVQMGAKQAAASRKCPTSSKHGSSSSKQPAPSTKGLLLEPCDPMVLARQRRPSVTNQASVNVDQQALFAAVECNQLEKAHSILESGKVNVNSLSGDKLTCLDIAVLMRNFDMVCLLQMYGAKESSAYLTRTGRENQLFVLYLEAKRLVEDLARSLDAMAPSGGQQQQHQLDCLAPTTTTTDCSTTASETLPAPLPSPATSADPAAESNLIQQPSWQAPQLMLATGSLLSSALLEEKQRQLQYWRRRLYLFMHMRYEFDRLEVPCAPHLVVLQVVGERSLGVKIVHSSSVSRSSQKICKLSKDDSPLMLDSKILRTVQCPFGANCSHKRLMFSPSSSVEQPPPPQSNHQAVTGHNKSSTAANFQDFTPQTKLERQIQAKQQRLYVFNQLLAQQLSLLCQQQQQNQIDRFIVTSSTSSSAFPSAGRQRQLRWLNQNTSAESACDSFEHIPTGQDAFKRLVNGSPADDEDPCPSLAYRLMSQQSGSAAFKSRRRRSTKRYVAQLISGEAQHQPAESHQAGGGGTAAEACKSAIWQSKQVAAATTLLASSSNSASASSSSSSSARIITKFKVEWSLNESFEPVLNSMIVYNHNKFPLESRIDQLESGKCYYVRVAAGNHRGFSHFTPTTPICLSPSSWRQVDKSKRRKYDEQVFRKFTQLILLNKHILSDQQASLLTSVASSSSSSSSMDPRARAISANLASNQNKSSLINMLLLDAASPSGDCWRLSSSEEISLGSSTCNLASSATSSSQQQSQSGLGVRKNLKNLFQSSSFKFHKLNNQNKRGLYFCVVIFYSTGESSNQNDKILVTNDDRLPVIEVINDLVSPGALMSDFYWLLKINGTQWMDIKRLRQQLQKSHSSSTLHLRIKLLNAIEQMQIALNLEDIGRLFYKPIQAHDGSLIIATCKQVATTKSVSNLSTKWTPQHKVIPRHLRKISDSMMRQQQQQQEIQIHRKDPPTICMFDSSSVSTTTTTAAGADRQPCDFCQSQAASFLASPHQAARRSTMASGSSSSSIASSNESQWSASNLQLPAQQQNKCTCKSNLLPANSSFSQRSSQQLTAALTSLASQRNSAPSTRSGSMISTSTGGGGGGACQPATGQMPLQQQTSTNSHFSSISSGYSHQSSMFSQRSQSQQLQKSSTYLMQASLSLYDLLLFTLDEIIKFNRTSMLPLKRGLYLGFVQLQTTVESMRLLVPRSRPNMVPCTRVRDNAHVSREEWQLLKSLATGSSSGAGLLSTGATPGSDQISPTRASDPSVQQLRTKLSLTAGFERDRAKSVSPGFEAGHCSASSLAASLVNQRSNLSVSSEQVKLATPATSANSNSNSSSAHSDGDITGAMEQSLDGQQAGRLVSLSRLYGHATRPEDTFVRMVGDSARRLMSELRCQLPKVYDDQTDEMISLFKSLNDDENNRIYHLELIELSSQVTFILLIPSAENVCPVTSHDRSNILIDNRDYMLLPLQIFETIHVGTYEPDLLGKYSRLSALLETDLIVAQHDHRQAFSSNELKSTKMRVSSLQDMVSIADEFWRQLRWIVDVVSFARDKSAASTNDGIRLASLWKYSSISPSHSLSGLCQKWAPIRQGAALARTNKRSGLEVKRAKSARQTADLAPICSKEAMDSVPEIHLSQSSNTSTSSTAASAYRSRLQSQGAMSASQKSTSLHKSTRRHSGDSVVPSHPNANNAQPNIDGLSMLSCSQTTASTSGYVGSLAAAAAAPSDGHSHQTVATGDNLYEDEDEAIYAYHISLRDATRAAARRKQSQNSTRPLIDELNATHLLDSAATLAAGQANESHRGGVSEAHIGARRAVMSQSSGNEQTYLFRGGRGFAEGSLETQAPSLDDSAGRQQQTSEDLSELLSYPTKTPPAATGYEADDFDWFEQCDKSLNVSTGGGQKEPETTRASIKANLRQRKSTNPFLSDSFDC